MACIVFRLCQPRRMLAHGCVALSSPSHPRTRERSVNFREHSVNFSEHWVSLREQFHTRGLVAHQVHQHGLYTPNTYQITSTTTTTSTTKLLYANVTPSTTLFLQQLRNCCTKLWFHQLRNAGTQRGGAWSSGGEWVGFKSRTTLVP
jgi:hypothetical protein